MIIAAATAALLLAPQTAPRTPPAATQAPPAQDFTSSLNSGPPRPADYLAPAPAPVTTPPPSPAPAPATPARETSAPAPAATRPATPAPATTTAPPPAARPAPAPATTPSPTRPTETPPAARPVTPPAATTPPATSPTPASARPAAAPTPAPAVTAPAPAAAEPPPPPATPAVTVLDAAARAALPFTVELPSGFEIVTGRPGPDFKIYTIRRGERSFAMVYAGPASQFPIYSGQQVEAAGRLSVVAAEGNERHALEHLFQRPDAPREIHVWTMSLEGADRALAERIAQSVDVR